MQCASPLSLFRQPPLHKRSFAQWTYATVFAMPVKFITAEQRADYGRYVTGPTPMYLAQYFHLDDTDSQFIAGKRGYHNLLVFSAQLTTVLFLGCVLDDTTQIPAHVLNALARQLELDDPARCIADYHGQRQRLRHTEEICARYGYIEITERQIGYRLTRWLYVLCWTGTDRPSVLFDLATSWLIMHKVMLPDSSTLERYITRLRSRVEERISRLLGRCISHDQQARLESLLVVPAGSRSSELDRLRTGPVMISSQSLIHTLRRFHSVREFGVQLPAAARIPATRVAALARFAGAAKVSAILRLRLPDACRVATLVAFAYCPPRKTMRWKCWRRSYAICTTVPSRLTRKHACAHLRIWIGRPRPWPELAECYWTSACQTPSCVPGCSRRFRATHSRKRSMASMH